MALDTNIGGSGITGYITKVRGNSTYFVREKVIQGADDYANTIMTAFDDAKTAGASVSGTQKVNFSGNLVGGNVAGFANTETLTANITIDNTVNVISIDVTPTTTVTQTVAAINADLTGTPVAISGGDLVVTSGTTGNASNVIISDDKIFNAMTNFVNIYAPVDGGTGGNLTGVTLNNGSNAWDMFSGAEEVFNTDDADVVIQTQYPTAVVSTVNAANLNAELNAIKAKLDALQEIASRKIDVISPVL